MDREEAAVVSGENVAELWYQLPAEEDASSATLTETVAHGEHTDYPSLEEGTLPSDTDPRKGFCGGRTSSLQLEVQDSQLSPRLPLLTDRSSPGHGFLEDTLFQKTEGDDFAPLRASLDMSEFPAPPSRSLQMSDAVELTSKEVTMDQEEGSASLVDTLHGEVPQHSSSFSEKDDKLESAVSKPTSSNVVEEMGKTLTSEDGAFLSSSVPAPVLLKLLEKEVGMSSSSENTSRRSSKSSSTGGSENTNEMRQQEADAEDKSLNASEPDVHVDPRATSKQSLEESFRDSSEVDLLKDVEGEAEDLSGITVRQTKQSYQPLREALHKQLCSEIQQRYQERSVSNTTKTGKETVRLQNSSGRGKIPTEPPNKIDVATEEAHLRDELSMSSSCSIERGHKDREMSHLGNTPVDEILFFGSLPHPISQSTPGTFTMNQKSLSGRIQQIKAKLTGSDMSLNEEPSAQNKTPSAEHQSTQSSQGYPKSSDSQRSLSPQRRIQSLPSLNYIEKVGNWNTSQSFDVLVLRGLTGMSPKKLAYNAVADSLNRMLSRQTSATSPKNRLSTSFKATSSMTNLSAAEKESPAITRITRSQSYNSVLPGGEQSEVGETTKFETSQSHVSLRGSSSISDNTSKRVEKTTGGSSVGHDHPTRQTSSEFKDSSQQKVLDISGNRSRTLVTMDRFSDVSLDQDCANSSQSSNEEKELLPGSVTSVKHTLTGEERRNSWSPTDETSRKEELDIEERIPTYLRNLGIDQSPTTILTPFAPKGPIREPEFSPIELRTIKGSTATPNRSMRLSEGGSRNAVNISQSSLYSSTSTTSVSIPMGSDVGPESPLPTEMSPPSGSGSDDGPISQDDAITGGAARDLGGRSHHVERPPAIQPIHDPNSLSQGLMNADSVESLRVKELIEQFESGGYDGPSLHDGQAPSLHGHSKRPPTANPVNDSFVGSKTLKEIRKLLAEADSVGRDRTSSSLSRASPVGNPYTKAPTRCLELEDSLNSRSASPLDLLVKDMSWDSSFNSSSTGGHLVNKDSSTTWNKDSLRSSSLRDDSYLGEPVGNGGPLAAPLGHWGRSEPEGCSKAATIKVIPSVAVSCPGERDLVDITERSDQLLSSVSTSVGGLRTALAVTGTGYVGRSEMGSDESTGDSLAARVISLLRNDTPSSYTAQNAEEEERRARGSVKLRLTGHPMMPDTELSAEDRRRIEEIKRELLDRAEKDRSHSNKLVSSGDTGPLRLHLTPSPVQLLVTSSLDSMEDTRDGTSDGQHKATYGGITQDVSSVTSDQPLPTSFYGLDRMTELHTQETPRSNVNELEKENLLLIKATEEATKPISSITFSSRKRSSPPSTSPDGGSQLLPSDFQVVSDKSPTNQDLDLGPSSVPSVVHKDHHIDHPDPSLSDPIYKDVVPALLTSPQWPTGDSTTQDCSRSSWAVVPEYSADASLQPTSAPSSETFSAQKEHLDPRSKNANSEGSLIINHQIESNGGEDQLKSCSGLITVEEAGEAGLLPSSFRDFQTKPVISSPTRKALSCIHVTISPKDDMKVLDVSKALVSLQTDNGSRANEDTSRSSSANVSRINQVLSHNDLLAGRVSLRGSHVNPMGDSNAIHEDIGQFMGKENIPERLIQPERRRSPLSDATTQITTESPQKTTFSAEIFVEGSIRGSATPSALKADQTFKQQIPSHASLASLSCLSRATDQPLLLPYRPLGSPELFYVPFIGGGSRMSPVSTIESSHPGSNDAISPKFPSNVLGSASEKLSDPSIPRHTAGIYSKELSPDTAERKQKSERGPSDDLKSSQYPQLCQVEKDSGNFNRMSSSSVHHRRSGPAQRSDAAGLQPFPASTLEDNEFLPLQPEMDYSQEQSDSILPERFTALAAAEKTKTYSASNTELPGLSQKSAQTPGNESGSPRGSLDGSVSRSGGERRSNQSLDDLWARYMEGRGRQTTQPEGSLVERLERLARLLQNPPPHSLMSSTGEKKNDNHQRRETKTSGRWYSGRAGADSMEDGLVGKPLEDSTDSGSLHSDPLSDMRSAMTDGATTESQTGSDTLSGSASASTIDTIRLINAFGPERVLPSSRLSRLYSTIDLQKKRTEETAKGSKRTSAGREQSKKEVQEPLRSKMAESESVTSSNSLWEPSPALRQKRSGRRLNKGVQAGELEIVMSATRRNTRDVGTTFPSPAGERPTYTADPAASVNMGANTRMTKNRVKATALHIPPGLAWFVSAENLKSESRKENESEVWRGRGPAWYEPVTSTKPWREPLREKNQQVAARPDGPIHGVIPDTWDKPFIRVTLQESLRSHRPDFIFRSGARVKRLQLLAEERKLQSVFQGERDELFNQPPQSGVPRYKDSRLLQQKRSVPKREMIERSKRIYEQLPEIRKRKEDEKRRSEYETYRLKAQLYRKKVTNCVLGRKTPWT